MIDYRQKDAHLTLDNKSREVNKSHSVTLKFFRHK